MKTKKNIFAIIIAMAMTVATLVGCSESEPIATEPLQQAEYQINSVEAEIEIYRSRPPLPFTIGFNVNHNFTADDFRNMLTSDITESRQSGVSTNDLSEITEFYFPHIEISGFELFGISVPQSEFRFSYAHSTQLENTRENRVSNNEAIYNNSIEIAISRPGAGYRAIEYYGVDNLFEATVAMAQYQGWGYLTESGMLYAATHRHITARLGDGTIRITAPHMLNISMLDIFVNMGEFDELSEAELDELRYELQGNPEFEHMGSYEFLSRLMLQVIDSLELVQVN